MSDVLIIPSIMLRWRLEWNGGYKLIVRLGATANKKERSCPRFLIVEFFGVRRDTRSPLWPWRHFSRFEARAHRDRKRAWNSYRFRCWFGQHSTCNQTVMSGGITIGFVDVAAFCLNPIAFVALRLGRFWCETGAVAPARADESGFTSIGLYRRTLFRMNFEQIDLALSRLKQGFDSPRERQWFQLLMKVTP